MSRTELTTSQAAERLGVGKSTVNLWCRQGRFPNAYAKEEARGPVWYIPAGDLEGFTPPPMGRPSKTQAMNSLAKPAETTARLNTAFRDAKEAEEARAKKVTKKGKLSNHAD